jgi:hypothetical protein
MQKRVFKGIFGGLEDFQSYVDKLSSFYGADGYIIESDYEREQIETNRTEEIKSYFNEKRIIAKEFKQTIDLKELDLNSQIIQRIKRD